MLAIGVDWGKEVPGCGDPKGKGSPPWPTISDRLQNPWNPMPAESPLGRGGFEGACETAAQYDPLTVVDVLH